MDVVTQQDVQKEMDANAKAIKGLKALLRLSKSVPDAASQSGVLAELTDPGTIESELKSKQEHQKRLRVMLRAVGVYHGAAK